MKGYLLTILGIASVAAIVSLGLAVAVALWGVVLWIAGIEKALPAAVETVNGGEGDGELVNDGPLVTADEYRLAQAQIHGGGF